MLCLKVITLKETCHVTSALTNQQQVFKACLTQMEQDFDDVTRNIGPLDYITSSELSRQ